VGIHHNKYYLIKSKLDLHNLNINFLELLYNHCILHYIPHKNYCQDRSIYSKEGIHRCNFLYNLLNLEHKYHNRGNFCKRCKIVYMEDRTRSFDLNRTLQVLNNLDDNNLSKKNNRNLKNMFDNLLKKCNLYIKLGN
jgi:hypothetical protein